MITTNKLIVRAPHSTPAHPAYITLEVSSNLNPPTLSINGHELNISDPAIRDMFYMIQALSDMVNDIRQVTERWKDA